jgi:hypothetical protein
LTDIGDGHCVELRMTQSRKFGTEVLPTGISRMAAVNGLSLRSHRGLEPRASEQGTLCRRTSPVFGGTPVYDAIAQTLGRT